MTINYRNTGCKKEQFRQFLTKAKVAIQRLHGNALCSRIMRARWPGCKWEWEPRATPSAVPLSGRVGQPERRESESALGSVSRGIASLQFNDPTKGMKALRKWSMPIGRRGTVSNQLKSSVPIVEKTNNFVKSWRTEVFTRESLSKHCKYLTATPCLVTEARPPATNTVTCCI